MPTKLHTISTYLTDSEKERIEKAAISRCQSVSTYIKESLLNHLDNAPDIPQSWIEKAKANGFESIDDFLNTAVNSYKLPHIAAAPDNKILQDEISKLKDENIKLQAEIINLKAPKVDIIEFAQHRDSITTKLESILTDKYISVQELCKKLDIEDEDDYNHLLNAVRYIENIEYNARFGYRVKP